MAFFGGHEAVVLALHAQPLPPTKAAAELLGDGMLPTKANATPTHGTQTVLKYFIIQSPQI